MACHFSGDYESNPTWKMKFDKKHYVKSVRFFNAQNGLNTSNIQGGQIFVDDKFCAKIGPKLPFNDFVSFECVD